MFSVDGLSWNIPCSIERTAEVTPSEISGMLLDKTYFNDVIATYMRYSVSIAVPFGSMNDYVAIYEKLTEPVEGHTFTFPYNEETITVTGRVESVTDALFLPSGGGQHWRGIKFSVLANVPTKTLTLQQVITRGRQPMPGVANVTEGTSYTYTENGWEESTYTDGDNISW